MSFRPRSAASIASLTLVSLLGLSACNSTPSHRRVVLDQIDALGLPAAQPCMNQVVGTYENSELEGIADAEQNKDLNWNDENALASGTPELQAFVARLQECITGEGAATETTEAPGTTDVSETTESSETTEVSETTESADTTEAVETTEAETTEAVETTEA